MQKQLQTYNVSLETIDGPRPAQVYKTFALIGVDESDLGNIVWSRWQISNLNQVN
jgi:hypothetical protein